ncbi:MAG: hypothetical protein ILNGONEN_01798 [Syntrophorhabdaceae bacterium]|nr:hypothetical protein [Syntrophorhabdaceae bacterium]
MRTNIAERDLLFILGNNRLAQLEYTHEKVPVDFTGLRPHHLHQRENYSCAAGNPRVLVACA